MSECFKVLFLLTGEKALENTFDSQEPDLKMETTNNFYHGKSVLTAQKRIFAPKGQTLIKLLRFRQSLFGLKSKDSGKVRTSKRTFSQNILFL